MSLPRKSQYQVTVAIAGDGKDREDELISKEVKLVMATSPESAKLHAFREITDAEITKAGGIDNIVITVVPFR